MKHHTTLLSATLIVAAIPAHATLYHLTLCGEQSGPGSACYVRPAPLTSPAIAVTDDAGRQYIEQFGIPVDDLRVFNGSDANKDGYSLGSMFGDPIIDVQMVTHNGKIVCCTYDWPYSITGINDNNLFIGHDDSIPFITTELEGFLPIFPELDAVSQAFLEAHEWFLTQSDATFNAIDNDNRVEGSSRLGAFLLAPVSEVPEPNGLLAIAGALMLLLGWRARAAG